VGKFFNQKYLDSLSTSGKSIRSRHTDLTEDTRGKDYDVFLSHSSKDKDLVGKIRDVIEKEFGFDAYVDWDENSGMKRSEVANTVKKAMKHSKTLLIVKTKNSDESSWVSWETGYFEALNCQSGDNKLDRIGVLVIEDGDYNAEEVQISSTCYHQEYLLRYTFVNEDNLRSFIGGKNGSVSLYY
jgi:hypothetical protein